ncbi:helix-turn-helix transcriptional regulator [Rhizobium redzepovicii]|uniref:Helix-turn-helix transcriptional regulator n=1 Tax=Rhizobium redzepovicii TaxID=2867518 RepID=A0AAW8P583_9HYPH|nr:helix-turn-helix transcriptional regulator [Rhizobium redzepovicii]MDR9760558.1 helix-turn-helix transcriptional regulator [Rhizobium redzepovicii]
MDHPTITGRQLAAARTLAQMSQADVAEAANVSVPTLKRMEGASGAVPGMTNNVAAVVRALEAAGIAFIDGEYAGTGGPGVRLRDPS